MLYKTLVTKPAEQDITAARYLAEDLQNPIASEKMLDDVERAFASLEKMPKKHALVKNEELSSLGFRLLPVQNYLIFYIVRDNEKTVVIERFLHSRRDWNHLIGS